MSLHGGPGRQMAMVRARERKPGRDGGPTALSKDKALIDGMAFHEHPHPPPHCVPHLQQVTLCETNRSQATAALPGGIFRKVMENMEREKPGFQIFFFWRLQSLIFHELSEVHSYLANITWAQNLCESCRHLHHRLGKERPSVPHTLPLYLGLNPRKVFGSLFSSLDCC